MAKDIEGEDFDGLANAVAFIDHDLVNLFTRLAEYAKRKELSTRLDIPECTLSANEDGEFVFTLYLCPPRKNEARVEYWVEPIAGHEGLIPPFMAASKAHALQWIRSPQIHGKYQVRVRRV